MHDLEGLVRAAQEGDNFAFDRLVKRFQDAAFGLAYARLGDFELAQDAAQEAFIEAYRGLRGLQKPAAFPAWLRAIVLRQAARAANRRRPAQPLDSAAELATPDSGPLERLEQIETRGRLQAALVVLSEPQRQAWKTAMMPTYDWAKGRVGKEVLDLLAKAIESKTN